MTPLRGRGFVVRSMKKSWTKPVIRTFESLEEAAAYFRDKATVGEKEKVEELLERMRGSRGEGAEQPELRKNAKR